MSKEDHFKFEIGKALALKWLMLLSFFSSVLSLGTRIKMGTVGWTDFITGAFILATVFFAYTYDQEGRVYRKKLQDLQREQ